jgi:hypothetical protein
MPPVGANVSSFSVISERRTASRQRGLSQANRQCLHHSRHHVAVVSIV